MKAIDLKVLRDLKRQRGQLGAIAMVIACGVGVYVTEIGTMRTLEIARSDYYAEQRFGHVFAGLNRAPERVSRQLRALPGVQRVQTRVSSDVTLDVEGMVETATGRLLSIPDRGAEAVNAIRLRKGRLPEPGQWEEVVASEAFVEAHSLPLGARVGAVLNGRQARLEIVGVALSPEYTYSVGPGLVFPDDRRFGVFWMLRSALASSFDMDGAFNDVSLRIARDAEVKEVIAGVDRILRKFGGLGAIARKDQFSAFFLENEFKQLETFAFLVPTLFLLVAAFLLNIVFGRLLATQRTDIAALKAFGYRDLEVGLHYAKLVTLVLLVGWLLGLALASWLGSELTQIYGKYYRLPDLDYQLGYRASLEALAGSAIGAGLGTWAAIRRTVALPPAEAMPLEAPPRFRATLAERLGLATLLPTAARMVLREIERKPARALLSVAGVAFATSLTVVMSFGTDSMMHMLNVQFGLSQREDLQLTLSQPRSLGALSQIEALPGVLHAEPYRAVPVRLVVGRREKKMSITGVPRESRLSGFLDAELRDVEIPAEGLVLSRKLSEILGARAGELVQVEILEGERRQRDLRVARVVETYFGAEAFLSLRALCRLLGETESMNAARLLVDGPEKLPLLHAAVKETPLMAGATARGSVLRLVSDMLDENLGTMIFVSVIFSLIMALGVLYNTARIALAERSRELATLRVLGFRRSEVAAILVGELIVIVVAALPLGLLLGYGLSAALVKSPGFDTEQFRLPLVVAPGTYARAVLVTVGAAVISGWSAVRKLDRFDIVEVLKTRD